MHKRMVFLLFVLLLTACAMAQTQATAPVPAVPTAATATVAIPTFTAIPTETPSPTVDVVAVMKESIASKVGVPAEDLTVYPVEGSGGQEALVFAVDQKQGRQYLIQGDSKWELKYGWNANEERLELQAVDAAGSPLFTVLSVDPKGNVLLSRPDEGVTVSQTELYGNVLGDGERDKMLAELLGVPPATAEIDEAMARGAKLVPREGGVWEVVLGENLVMDRTERGVWESQVVTIPLEDNRVVISSLDGQMLALTSDGQVNIADRNTVLVNGRLYEWDNQKHELKDIGPEAFTLHSVNSDYGVEQTIDLIIEPRLRENYTLTIQGLAFRTEEFPNAEQLVHEILWKIKWYKWRQETGRQMAFDTWLTKLSDPEWAAENAVVPVYGKRAEVDKFGRIVKSGPVEEVAWDIRQPVEVIYAGFETSDYGNAYVYHTEDSRSGVYILPDGTVRTIFWDSMEIKKVIPVQNITSYTIYQGGICSLLIPFAAMKSARDLSILDRCDEIAKPYVDDYLLQDEAGTWVTPLRFLEYRVQF